MSSFLEILVKKKILADLWVCLEFNLKLNSTDWDCAVFKVANFSPRRKNTIHLFRAAPSTSVRLAHLHAFVRHFVQTDNLCERVAHLWQSGLRNEEKDHSQTEQRILCLLKNGAWAGGFKIFTERKVFWNRTQTWLPAERLSVAHTSIMRGEYDD